MIYWPEDATWDDSAASSVCRNRVTFMRSVVLSTHPFHILCCGSAFSLKYATKSLLYYPLSTQNISYGMTRKAMLNPLICPPANLIEYTHLRSLKRTSKRRMQFRTLVFRYPSSLFCANPHLTFFKMDSHHLMHHEVPLGYQRDPAALTPRLLRGETTQGFFTVSYIPPQPCLEYYNKHTFNRISLEELL
jgi:hypothetical protein